MSGTALEIKQPRAGCFTRQSQKAELMDFEAKPVCRLCSQYLGGVGLSSVDLELGNP